MLSHCRSQSDRQWVQAQVKARLEEDAAAERAAVAAEASRRALVRKEADERVRLLQEEVRQKRMAASPDVDDAQLASAVGDMHSWFYERTGELNDSKKKEQQTRNAYTAAHPVSTQEGSTNGVDEVDPLPAFSAAEVARHSTKDDCWVIIRGKVYDISPWLASHPGGPSILLKHAGCDATEMFTAVRGFRFACAAASRRPQPCRC